VCREKELVMPTRVSMILSVVHKKPINRDVIIHQRRGYLGEWAMANTYADKIDLLVLLLNFRIVRRKVKLLEIDALERSDGVDEHLTSDTLP
jgi:hypothetical protein